MEFNHRNMLLSKVDVKLFHEPNLLYDNRYCNQDVFSILVCGANTVNSRYQKASNDVYKLDGRTFECRKYPSMLQARYNCKTAIINSDIIVVGGNEITNGNTKYLYSVEIFKNKS